MRVKELLCIVISYVALILWIWGALHYHSEVAQWSLVVLLVAFVLFVVDSLRGK